MINQDSIDLVEALTSHVPPNPRIAEALFTLIAGFEAAFPEAPKPAPDLTTVNYIGQMVRNSWYTVCCGIGVRFFPTSYAPADTDEFDFTVLVDIFLETRTQKYRYAFSKSTLNLKTTRSDGLAEWFRDVVRETVKFNEPYP